MQFTNNTNLPITIVDSEENEFELKRNPTDEGAGTVALLSEDHRFSFEIDEGGLMFLRVVASVDTVADNVGGDGTLGSAGGQ